MPVKNPSVSLHIIVSVPSISLESWHNPPCSIGSPTATNDGASAIVATQRLLNTWSAPVVKGRFSLVGPREGLTWANMEKVDG